MKSNEKQNCHLLNIEQFKLQQKHKYLFILVKNIFRSFRFGIGSSLIFFF